MASVLIEFSNKLSVSLKRNRSVPGIFLAGPTPRGPSLGSWRVQATYALAQLPDDQEYVVYVPEPRFSDAVSEWMPEENQIEWEHKAIRIADVVVFWVPRDLQTLPGFTTNIEFGMLMKSEPEKLVYGRPHFSPKTSYMDYCAKKFGFCDGTPLSEIEEVMVKAAQKARELFEFRVT